MAEALLHGMLERCLGPGVHTDLLGTCCSSRDGEDPNWLCVLAVVAQRGSHRVICRSLRWTKSESTRGQENLFSHDARAR